MVKVPLPLNASTKRKHKAQALNATTKHKHKTQTQNASSNGGVWCLRFVPYLLLTSSMRHPIK
jgi:hypothetical protein